MSLRDPDAPAKPSDTASRRERRRGRSKKERAKLAQRDLLRHAPDDARHYAAMAKVILASLPTRAPGVTVGAVLEAARRGTSRNQFPGDTHRMWARKVLDDLLHKGTVAAADRRVFLRAA